MLNQVIYNINDKLKVVGDEGENDGREGRIGEAMAWAIPSQTSIVRKLNRMQHESREAEKSLKESNLSLVEEDTRTRRMGVIHHPGHHQHGAGAQDVRIYGDP
jgi:hypothetical protein